MLTELVGIHSFLIGSRNKVYCFKQSILERIFILGVNHSNIHYNTMKLIIYIESLRNFPIHIHSYNWLNLQMNHLFKNLGTFIIYIFLYLIYFTISIMKRWTCIIRSQSFRFSCNLSMYFWLLFYNLFYEISYWYIYYSNHKGFAIDI